MASQAYGNTQGFPCILQVCKQASHTDTPVPALQYYTPAILELAGFRDNRTALLVAMLPAAVNSLGTLIGMWQIDKCGRRQASIQSQHFHVHRHVACFVCHCFLHLLGLWGRWAVA